MGQGAGGDGMEEERELGARVVWGIGWGERWGAGGRWGKGWKQGRGRKGDRNGAGVGAGLRVKARAQGQEDTEKGSGSGHRGEGTEIRDRAEALGAQGLGARGVLVCPTGLRTQGCPTEPPLSHGLRVAAIPMDLPRPAPTTSSTAPQTCPSLSPAPAPSPASRPRCDANPALILVANPPGTRGRHTWPRRGWGRWHQQGHPWVRGALRPCCTRMCPDGCP